MTEPTELTDQQLVDAYATAGVEVRQLADEITRRDSAPLTASATSRGTPAGGHVTRMAAQSGPAAGSPERPTGRRSETSRATITASMQGATIAPGQVLTSKAELSEVMSETLRRIASDPVHFGRKHVCATARWEYPENRRLDPADITANTEKLDNVCGLNAPRVSRKTGALVATGGICLPTNVDYTVPTWVSTDRPLRDGLPAFQATRGGIQFVTPPDIGTVSLQGTASGSGTAVGIWTEATDANPAGATKPVWQVACGSPQQVYVDAVATRVEFGNMLSRFAPEQVSANTEQAVAAAARDAELNLLEKMYAASNQILAAEYLGATRDLLASVDLIAAGYRYGHRYPRNCGLTAVFPEWAIDLFRADLAREAAHDNAGSVNVLAISDDEVEDWFSVRGIEVIWTMDGLKAGTYGNGGSAIPAQFFAKATPGETPQWPGQTDNGVVVLSWLLFVTGTFQFLDGGRLDLGVVRDSTLDATNDYETFLELFEGIAFRGNECYQVQSTIKPNGGSAGTIGVTGYVE